jgi:ATP-dependent Lon protease
MVTSIISAITEIPVNKNVAMTGEITLRGLVLPIGGLKEKLLAAHRAGIKTVLIPIENKKDLVEVPKTILDTMEIIPVKNVDEVLKVALTKPLKRVEWVDVEKISNKEKDKKELSTH